MIESVTNFDSPHKLADWIEFYVLCQAKQISKAKLLNLLRDNDGENREELIDSAFQELNQRHSMLGNASPFNIEKNKISRIVTSWRHVPDYTMCLIFSLQGVKKIQGDDDGTKLFERLGKEAITYYVSGEGILLGFPNEGDFPNQIKLLATKASEQIGGRAPLPTDKDKGVDIVAWKPHKDLRGNQVVLLIQAAAGFHWNLKKPISRTAWREFIFWGAEPITGIIVPIVISQERWTSYRDDYNLLFDRIRIRKALYRKSFSDGNLLNEIKSWCSKELN